MKLASDRVGGVWVGTLSGLYTHDPHRKPIGHIGPGAGLPDRRGAYTVMSIYPDRSGSLWVGSLGEGLFEFEAPSDRTPSSFRSRPGDRTSLGDNLVWAIHEDVLGRRWVGTHSDLCLFRKEDRACSRIGIPAHVMASDSSGTVWFSGPSGLFRVGADGLDADRLAPAPASEAVSVNALSFIRDGLFCLGARDVTCHEPDAIDLENPVLVIPDSAVGALVWAIHQDADGLLWIGTRSGLLRYDPSGRELSHYYGEQGIPGSVVYSILEDRNHRLWLGTSSGLVSFDKSTGLFRHYDQDDGVQNVEFNRRAAAIGQDGRFYFGGLEGITHFHPDEIVMNPNEPPVVITRLQATDDLGTSERPVGTDLRFVADPSVIAFSIEYAALAFTSPRKNRYRYRLEGFEDQWIDAGFRRRAEYTNLDPGEYVFHVVGSNEDGVWNEAGTRLRIDVEPAWWETLLFRVAVVLALVFILTTAYRYRVGQILKMERMRLRIARDLHDDIGSRLSGLALMSDMVGSGHNLDDRQKGQLSRIGHGTREIVTSLRDIVWFVHPDHEQPGELLGRFRESADEILNGVEWNLETRGSAPFDGLDLGERRHVFLVFKEALNNISRHASASRVEVLLERRENRLHMTVKDDGQGFDGGGDPKRDGGYGLRNMRRRAEMLGGTLDISSELGTGTTVNLVVQIT